jgi:hypothetical protein
MITIQLMGGLGNMMFQIATVVALAKDHDDKPIFDTTTHYLPPQFLDRKCGKYLSNIFSKVEFSRDLQIECTYREPNFYYGKLPYKKNMCLLGYFQSEKYFVHRADDIKALFEPTEEIKQYIDEQYSHILEGETIGIHVRRGDYTNHPNIHPTCSPHYYQKALSMFKDADQYDIVVFSDDAEWCKNEFGSLAHVVENEADYIDLYLMSMCKHNIIANSSFSWWAAWLNANTDKVVVAPQRWFGPSVAYNTKDLYCAGWEII